MKIGSEILMKKKVFIYSIDISNCNNFLNGMFNTIYIFISGFHFYTVALHEIGHALGLAHSPVPDSVMFPYYVGHSSEDVLEYDDILAMYELYSRYH